jgi:serine/threonine-protein kinase
MATVHIGRLLGPVGFSRTVAIKRLHPQYAKESEFVSMFLDEARLAARVRHPNVVGTLDVVATEGELFLVMEYVEGESLARLIRTSRDRGEAIPIPITVSILVGALEGLHAAHVATSDQGEPLGLVHRDVSPQNILVGTDGVSRVVDFGVAKAAVRMQTTRNGQLKGKLGYMAPEQVNGEVTRATDIYAAGVILWEMLTRRRLHHSDNDMQTFANIVGGKIDPPSAFEAEVSPELDRVVMQALRSNPEERFFSAREMARALQHAAPMAAAPDVGDWVHALAAGQLSSRAKILAQMESSGVLQSAPSLPPLSDQSMRGIATVTPAPPKPQPKPFLWAIGAVGVLLLVAFFAVVLRLATSEPSPRPSAQVGVPSPGLSATRVGTVEPPSATLAPADIDSLPVAPPIPSSAKSVDAAGTQAPPRPRWVAPQPRSPAAEGTSNFSHVMDSRK